MTTPSESPPPPPRPDEPVRRDAPERRPARPVKGASGACSAGSSPPTSDLPHLGSGARHPPPRRRSPAFDEANKVANLPSSRRSARSPRCSRSRSPADLRPHALALRPPRAVDRHRRLAGGLALIGLAFANSLVGIIIAWTLVQICYNFAQGPLSAVMPDRVPLAAPRHVRRARPASASWSARSAARSSARSPQQHRGRLRHLRRASRS